MAELALNRLSNDSDDELSDDEEETFPLASAPSAPPDLDKAEHWDMFEDPPPPVSSMSEETEHFGATILKFAKLLVYLLTFGVVLCGGITTKLLTLLMAAQLKNASVTDLCPEGINELPNHDKQYAVTTTPLENMAWAYCLLFAYIAPEVGAWIRALRMCVFKGFVKKFWLRDVESNEKLEEVAYRRMIDMLVVVLMESCHSVGTALLVYAVLPDLDSIRGAMITNCLAFMPGVLGMFTRTNNDKNLVPKLTFDLAAVLSQLAGCIVWPLAMSFHDKTPPLAAWSIPFALILTSFGWWENFVDHRSNMGLVSYMGRIKRRLWRTRYVIYLVVPIVKCVLYFVVMVVVMGIRLDDFSYVFLLGQSLAPHNLTVTEVRVPLGDMALFSAGTADDVAPLMDPTNISPDPNTPVYVFLVHMLSAWLSYVCGKFVCKIAMQQFSFSLPVNLVVPVTVCLLMTVCGVRTDDVCAFSSTIPGYLFWTYEQGISIVDFFVIDFSWLWFLWLLSQTWITIHIWTPKTEKLARTEKIFVSPMYDSLFLDQSLALNRRRDDIEEEKKKVKKKEEEEERKKKEMEQAELQWEPVGESPDKVQPSDRTTRIYACATMWHETPDEMEEFLKSVMRVDEDQSARRIARTFLKINDPDYYEYQTHVFFDDAFEMSDDNEDYVVVNRFVKFLLGSMDVAASHVHHTIMRLRPPVRYPTPYGGRLVWTLPGKTKFIVHLKDKNKIRHKKRWSQVMYMYYLLGFKLMDQESLSVVRKEVIAENTYLLALDGDIDFTARSVRLLVELMKKDSNLGAACGRIHPVGSGLMVWYQKFEYAIGHWLQKATEHMIGCVLCSPGCFSMFRGRALMDDSVMRKYTTVSCKARHYVQYDQGEDRWLCTLLLKRGYRVEYSAASDAYTHCPEGFGEFYNQRRRWVPSTMANIMDVLEDYKLTVKINDNISMLYIAYQMMLMVGTILGPGTIFMMLVGALSAAFGMSDQRAFILNLIPILAFMITCYFAKSATQLRLAYVLTAVYALLMCMVAIALAINIIEEGATTPTSIFLFATAFSFIVTACLHPQEFWCLPSGLVYYLVVPSMYLLLQIYSCYNLNDVSWGTRDTPVKKTKEEMEREKKELEEAQKKQTQTGWLAFLMSNDKKKEEGSIEFNLAGLFKIMCCVQPKANESEHILRSIDGLKRQLERMEAHVGVTTAPPRRRSTMAGRASLHSSLDPGDINSVIEDVEEASDVESHTSAIKEERNDLINPFWMEDKKAFGSLGYKGGSAPGQSEGAVKFLTKTEVTFWEGVMDRYLRPLDKNKADEDKAKQELLDLRNMAVFSFSMMNAIFVVIVALMQAHQDILYVNWPIGAKTNITYVYSEETPDQIEIAQEYVHLEPIGFVFVIFFGAVMIVQFTAMLFHRFGTFSQIIASTSIPCARTKKKPRTSDGVEVLSPSEAIANIKLLQKVKPPDPVDQDTDTAQMDFSGRRRTIANIASSHRKPQVVTLDEAFHRRVSMAGPDDSHNDINRRRSTVRLLANNQRRMSVRRPSYRSSVSNVGAV